MPNDGRFLTRDTWMGDYISPLSLNRWMYVEGNPVNLTDPSGLIPCSENQPVRYCLLNNGGYLDQYLRQLGSRNWLRSGMNHAQTGNLLENLG